MHELFPLFFPFLVLCIKHILYRVVYEFKVARGYLIRSVLKWGITYPVLNVVRNFSAECYSNEEIVPVSVSLLKFAVYQTADLYSDHSFSPAKRQPESKY